MSITPEQLAALRQPFPINKVQWRVQGKPFNQGNRQMVRVVPYLDARDVEQRLDEVMGGDWSWDLQPIDEFSGKGILTVGGVTRVGLGQEGQSDAGKGWKAIETDAMKRAGVRFGIGRYLYYTDPQYMPARERGGFEGFPQLPDWALPGSKAFDAPRTVGFGDTEEETSGPLVAEAIRDLVDGEALDAAATAKQVEFLRASLPWLFPEAPPLELTGLEYHMCQAVFQVENFDELTEAEAGAFFKWLYNKQGTKTALRPEASDQAHRLVAEAK